MKRFLIPILAALACCASAQATVVSTLGDQDFLDGKSPINPAEMAAAGAGEPAPFNGTIFGSDPGGTFGEFVYTHSFVLGGAPLSATLTLGLIDHDSPASAGSLDTIDIFFDGILQDDSMWRGISGEPSSVSVRSMSVDPALLLDGSLTVRVVATLAAPGFAGNAIAPDFSRLDVDLRNDVPLPGSMALLALGLAGLAAARRRTN